MSQPSQGDVVRTTEAVHKDAGGPLQVVGRLVDPLVGAAPATLVRLRVDGSEHTYRAPLGSLEVVTTAEQVANRAAPDAETLAAMVATRLEGASGDGLRIEEAEPLGAGVLRVRGVGTDGVTPFDATVLVGAPGVAV